MPQAKNNSRSEIRLPLWSGRDNVVNKTKKEFTIVVWFNVKIELDVPGFWLEQKVDSFLKSSDRLLRGLERAYLINPIGKGLILDQASAIGDAFQIRVVKHENALVARDVDICFDTIGPVQNSS